MANKTSPLLPGTVELLAALGERLRLARQRRKLTAAQVAARAGMAPLTLRNVERGADGVTIGAYLAVMQVLGLETDLSLLAAMDDVGRQIQDATLPGRRNTAKPGGKPTPKSVAPSSTAIGTFSSPPSPAFIGVRESEPEGRGLVDDYRAQMDALFNAKEDT